MSGRGRTAGSRLPAVDGLAAPTLFVVAGCLLLPPALAAQEAGSTARVTADDYARAERLLGWNAEELVSGVLEEDPTWFGDGEFWYRLRRGEGHRFVLVDPDAGTRRPAFDHARLAAALSEAADTSYVAEELPFRSFEFADGRRAIRFHVADSVRWTCDVEAYACSGPDTVPRPPPGRGRLPGRAVGGVRPGREPVGAVDGDRRGGPPLRGRGGGPRVRRRPGGML